MDRSRLGLGALVQLACLFLSLLLCAYLALSDMKSSGEFDSERLYWEYAGRILGAEWTLGYPEWVQFRSGALPAESAQAVARGALAPYTDFLAEYPPGALLYFTALRTVFDEYKTFAAAHSVVMVLAFVLSLILGLVSLRGNLATIPPRRGMICTCLAALACPVMVYLIGGFIVSRFDALTAVLAAGAVLLAQRRHPTWAGIFLGLAGAIKLWPLFLVPFLFGTRRAYVWLGLWVAITFAVCHAGLLVLGTQPGDLLGYLTYAFDRPVHSESLLAMGRYLSEGPSDLVFSFGSWGLPGGSDTPVPGLMQNTYLALLSGCAFWRLFKDPALFDTTAAADPADPNRQAMIQLGTIALLLGMAKVFSGEYMVWIVPAVIAAAGYGWGLPVLLGLLAMAGVKLGYVFSEQSSAISQSEIIAFGLKWAALLALVLCAIIALVSARRVTKNQ